METFKFVPTAGKEETINNTEKVTGRMHMAYDTGKIFFDKSDSERVLIAQKDSNFIFNQIIPSSVWTINHNLNKLPNITIIDSAGTEVKGEIEYVDDNNLILTFSSEFSGRAILN